MPPRSYRAKIMQYMTTEQRQDLEIREKDLGRALTHIEFRQFYPMITIKGVRQPKGDKS